MYLYRCGSALGVAVLAGCSPSLDWREVRSDESAVIATFPCRPGRHQREVTLAGRPVRLTLLSCEAGGALFALSFGNVAEASQIAPTLDALRLAVAQNLSGPDAAAAAAAASAPTATSGATAPAAAVAPTAPAAPAAPTGAFAVRGMTPNAQSLQMHVLGRRPDGSVVEAQVAVFSVGPQVVQAQVLASRLDAAATETFLSGLQVNR